MFVSLGVVGEIGTYLALEIIQFRVLVDFQQLQVQHFRKITQVLNGHGLAESRVMRAAAQNPGSCGNLQVGPGLPQGPGYR